MATHIVEGVFAAFIAILCGWCYLCWRFADDEPEASEEDFAFEPLPRPTLRQPGNSHQRRIARRKLERAKGLGKA